MHEEAIFIRVGWLRGPLAPCGSASLGGVTSSGTPVKTCSDLIGPAIGTIFAPPGMLSTPLPAGTMVTYAALPGGSPLNPHYAMRSHGGFDCCECVPCCARPATMYATIGGTLPYLPSEFTDGSLTLTLPTLISYLYQSTGLPVASFEVEGELRALTSFSLRVKADCDSPNGYKIYFAYYGTLAGPDPFKDYSFTFAGPPLNLTTSLLGVTLQSCDPYTVQAGGTKPFSVTARLYGLGGVQTGAYQVEDTSHSVTVTVSG